MYIINTLEYKLIENSFRNMRSDKTKATKITTTNGSSPENEKEALESSNIKKTQSEKGNKHKVSNKNDIVSSISELLTSSVEMEKLSNDKTLPVNGNPPLFGKRIDSYLYINISILSPSD